MKKILVFLSFCMILFGQDATISVVNKGVQLPKIYIKDQSNLADLELKKSFYNMLVNDIKVSANYEIVKEENQGDYIFSYILNKNGKLLDINIDIFAANEVKAKIYEQIVSVEEYPFLAHKSVSQMNKKLGYAPVDWMDHKILIARTQGSKQSDILLADYTLTYQKILISKGLNLFPKWANKEQSAFYFTAYDDEVPTLYKYDIKNKNTTKIIASKGMMVASDISDDGKKILLTMAPKDQPDIYLYDINTKNYQQITNYSGIDVNGNFIDGVQKIAFVSDRLGYPNIFMQDLQNNTTEQVVFHGKNNSSVSTYKNYMVYSSREHDQNGVFNLYLMSTQSDYIRQLTANGKNLFPRFSSDGESIVFIKYLGSQSALGIIRINANKAFYYGLKVGKIQSIDW
ncbi:Tol-Pal system protein TolB [Campylobacter insulaenigrae]|uniref:Tol-Pal system translocation protein TolB n=1 Tax=Campylobacter insulaenigrae NCTC 12927 TaxID=1031564 RepID=A0A0A8H2S1_9BACT|nr:Tol-Pal system protein TolB [Campylobacter insulaenigrae]AJC87194.1 Tol-Pal system translocation protein TolB [Campylobacter insulaenigrae NCTC 12927]MCR6572873.1 Tol-Pal system protein TolB [Campylobacter insulaenigrae]MCR6574217.1 Tol-Pal system protein TolB [Campylobacter insulaenigrae]MCR6575866.1 Tol-Pal system protein TolB [Campylobacter insulaenigrae]MCR6577345.1 Tol-Pal system protein TolB [Campylobacter insulaenigrae]